MRINKFKEKRVTEKSEITFGEENKERSIQENKNII